MMYLLVMLLPYVALALEDDSPYCTVRFRSLCQGKGLHVACQYPVPGPGPNCQNYTQVKFDRDLKHYITGYINRRRQRIAAGVEHVRGGARLPKPRIMMFVEWDRELATLAQRLADQCKFIHDNCRATTRYPYAGQTVGEVRPRRGSNALGAKTAVRRVLDAWWGERRRALPRDLIEPFHLSAKGSVWGHFSQFALSSLRAVGCGAARHGSDRPRFLLVCDFSHTNMLGQRTIEPGPLALCPENTRRRPHSGYPLLCAAYHYESGNDDDSSEIDYRIEDDFVDETTTKSSTKSHRSSVLKRRRTKSTRVYVPSLTSTRRFMPVPKKNASRKLADPFKNKLAQKTRTSQKENQKEEEFRVLGMNRVKENKHRPNVGKSPVKDGSRLQEDGDLRAHFGHRKNQPVLNEMEYRRPLTSSPWTLRQRGNWKQTRDRPRRPGEMALLHISTESMLVPMVHDKKTTGSLFLMDKDDVDQLFKDTGFQPAWRKTKS